MTTPARVLFLNDVGFQYGAGIGQARQVQALLLAGFEVGALAWEPCDLGLKEIATRPFPPHLWLGLRRARHLEAGAPMTDPEILAGLCLEVARFRPDVVVVGNLHAARWPLQLLPALAALGCRVVAYLHDGHLFTGRCAYPGSCRLYLTGCDHTCPTATEYPPLAPELIAGQWRLRREIFNGPDGIEVAANSDWTRDQFRAALPACRSCETVYLGADEEIFRPGDQAAARAALGLPRDRPVVLCAAVNFEERRKGADCIQQLAADLHAEATFVALGHNSASIPGLVGLGYTTDPGRLALIYQAADLFLGTAREEAFGQTTMEAQLCGLPVVAFGAGGIPEIVADGQTGRLVPVEDTRALAAALRSALADPAWRAAAGATARTRAAARFSLAATGARWRDYLARPPA